MTRTSWNNLSPTVRRIIIVTGVFEGVLKLAALVDLARRPPGQVRGSKLRWAVAILVINSAGAVPIAYFRRGRRQTDVGQPVTVTGARSAHRR